MAKKVVKLHSFYVRNVNFDIRFIEKHIFKHKIPLICQITLFIQETLFKDHLSEKNVRCDNCKSTNEATTGVNIYFCM